MMAACVVSSFCGWTSSGRWRAISVIYLVRSLSFEPASPLLPGLMAKETLNFFLLFKVEGSSMHIVLLVLWILTYIHVQCVYLYFLHVLFSLLCLGILEVKEFLLFFLRICARHPFH